MSHPSEKYERHLGLLFTIYGKIKNVPIPNHQTVISSRDKEHGTHASNEERRRNQSHRQNMVTVTPIISVHRGLACNAVVNPVINFN